MRQRRQQGYSLIELVIYVALFAGISVVIVHSLVTVMRTYGQTIAYRRIQSNGELVMERIVREVRQATTVNTAASTFNTTPGTLSLTGTDNNSVTHTVIFSVANGVVQINDNGTIGNLSSTEVTISNLIFRRFTTPVRDGIKVELTLANTSGLPVSAPFYETVLLRGK